MDELIHHWEYEGRTITFSWVADRDVVPSRVYAFAYVHTGDMLLVGGAPGDGESWLPGGGVEPGESPDDALARELLEEAAATLHEMRRIGSQRVDDPAIGSEYHSFYWCRITLADDFVPEREVAHRRLVPPNAFLDTLFWGRSDPKAAVLFEQAMNIEASMGAPPADGPRAV